MAQFAHLRRNSMNGNQTSSQSFHRSFERAINGLSYAGWIITLPRDKASTLKTMK